MKNKELERLDRKIEQALAGLSPQDRKKFLGEALQDFEKKLEKAKKATDEDPLRRKVIRLAYQHPELRKDLLPLLDREAARGQSAAEAYANRTAEIEGLLRTFQRRLKNHARDFQRGGSTGWDYVGDLGYWAEKLREISG